MARCKQPRRPLNRLIRYFWRDQEGSATIEAVLWIPMFFFTLLLVMEGSLIFNAQALAMRIVQDTNRAIAVGIYPDSATAQAQLLTRIRTLSPTATASARIENGLAISSVRMPVGDLSRFGFFRNSESLVISASSQQLVEK